MTGPSPKGHNACIGVNSGRKPLECKQQIRDFIIENFLFGSSEAPFSDDESFLESGIIDSTGILELVSFVEERFDIEVKDEDLIPENFDSVGKLVGYINNKTNKTH